MIGAAWEESCGTSCDSDDGAAAEPGGLVAAGIQMEDKEGVVHGLIAAGEGDGDDGSAMAKGRIADGDAVGEAARKGLFAAPQFQASNGRCGFGS